MGSVGHTRSFHACPLHHQDSHFISRAHECVLLETGTIDPGDGQISRTSPPISTILDEAILGHIPEAFRAGEAPNAIRRPKKQTVKWTWVCGGSLSAPRQRRNQVREHVDPISMDRPFEGGHTQQYLRTFLEVCIGPDHPKIMLSASRGRCLQPTLGRPSWVLSRVGLTLRHSRMG